MKPALVKIGLVSTGYLVAVAAAVVVTETIMIGAPMLLSGPGSLTGIGGDLPGMFIVGFFWTFLCALPGFVVAIIIGERRGWLRWSSYAFAGTANAAPALAIFSGLAGSPFDMPLMVVGAFVGGFAGGSAYWAGTGRVVARHRKAIPA